MITTLRTEPGITEPYFALPDRILHYITGLNRTTPNITAPNNISEFNHSEMCEREHHQKGGNMIIAEIDRAKAAWTPGYEPLFHGADAQAVYQEIIEIGESATPKQILDKARSKKTELHKCFTWDDKIASEKWRLQEARSVVTHLIIKEIDNQKVETPVRLLHKVDKRHDTGYKAITLIMANEDDYKALLRQAKAEMISFKNKYRTLAELEEVLAVMDQTILGLS